MKMENEKKNNNNNICLLQHFSFSCSLREGGWISIHKTKDTSINPGTFSSSSSSSSAKMARAHKFDLFVV